MIYLKLFLSFFKLGLFGFGGGYAIVSLLEQEIINHYPLVPTSEVVDILAISEMTPGPIAINAATFFGYRVAGLLGAIVATVSVILPSFIIMSILLYILAKYKGSNVIDNFIDGVKPVVIGLILSGAFAVGKTALVDFKSLVICLTIFYLTTFKKLNGIYAIILAAVVGGLLY